jgi:cytochrome c oxidase subunit 2
LLALALVDTRREYDHLFGIYVPIAVGVFGLFFLLIIGNAVRSRVRAPGAASRTHENNPLELSYAVLLVGTVAVLLWLTFSAEHRVDTVSLKQKPYTTIDVTASQWEWTFYYPGAGITQRSGFVGKQPLVVPTNEPVRLNLYSRDVIHAFWVPYLRYKHDLIQGSRQVIELDFPTAGLFPGHCSQYCGLHHAEMVFNVRALSPSRYQAWLHSGGRTGP